MRSHVLLAAALMSLSGCIIDYYGGGGGGGCAGSGCGGSSTPTLPGDVTFTWSFAGRTCSEVPQVRAVRIEIPGERLQNEGVYPCLANNYPGIVLHDFAPGRYSFTISALGYANEQLFTGAGTFTINGDTRATIDLTPTGGGSSYAYLSWSFPANAASANPNCDQAGVTHVDVSIDGASFERLPCSSGLGQPGVQSPYLSAGTHSIEMLAVTSSGYPLYRFQGSLQTFSGAPVSAEYRLSWAVGGAAVRWQITNGSLGLTCTQAQIQRMTINFEDTQGNLVYGSTGDTQACDAAPILYNFLKPGTYRVYVKGTGSSGAVYLSNTATPPVITVVAGQFPQAQGAATVQLFRVQ